MRPGPPKLIIHHDPNVVIFSVTGDELGLLEKGSSSAAKDFFIACFGFAVPCGINAFSDYMGMTDFKITLPLFLNTIIALVTIILGVFFFVGWRKEAKEGRRLVEKIKAKPKQEYVSTASDVGSLPVPTAEETTPK